MEQDNRIPAENGKKEWRELRREARERRRALRAARRAEAGVNFGKIFLGLVLVLIGVFYFARAVGWIPQYAELNWSELWPMLIIIFGFSLISGRGFVSTVIGGVFMLVVFILILYLFFFRLML